MSNSTYSLENGGKSEAMSFRGGSSSGASTPLFQGMRERLLLSPLLVNHVQFLPTPLTAIALHSRSGARTDVSVSIASTSQRTRCSTRSI